MKKFISILSIFLFLLFSINTVTTAAPPKSFLEGFYSINNLGLMENITYNVENISDYNAFIIIFDSDQKIQQALSLDPHSSKHPLKAIRNTDRIVILGQGELTFPY